MADCIRALLTSLRIKIEACHARHPNTCLVVWSASSFQVTELVIRAVAQALGLPWHPLIPL